MTNLIRGLVASMSLSMVIAVAIVLPMELIPTRTFATPLNELLEPQSTPQTEWQKALKNWIENLVEYESNGSSTVKVLDWNGKYSYGCLQFQEQTFLGFTKGLKTLPNATDEEIMNFIYDCEYQKLLAFKMIETNYDNWRHWRYSVINRGLGLPPILKAEDYETLK